jgi:hypothetical protein
MRPSKKGTVKKAHSLIEVSNSLEVHSRKIEAVKTSRSL